MTLNQYQLLAKGTCPSLFATSPLGAYLDSAHMLYGMMSEIPELLAALDKDDKVNIQEELSDIVWYLANYCTFNNISLNDLSTVEYANIPRGTHVEKITYWIGELADLEKKQMAYGKSFSVEKQTDVLQNLFFWVTGMFVLSGLNMFEGLEKNINKLKVRFPEKFDAEKAINRDLENERKQLE